MARKYALDESDDTFLATAGRRYVHVIDLLAPPGRVWEALCADDALVSWSSIVTRVEWTKPRPFGVGTTRVVTLAGAVRLEERFYRWNVDERMTFTVDAASVPGLRRFGEDIALEKTTGGTRLTWTFALEGETGVQPLLWLLDPANRIVTSGIARGIGRRVRDSSATA
ncbi:SRPBCC family protein [Nocardia sp. NBC_00403]|uniref:SRPBCC family protein n=1 Tax=Nocardia sp. NBC_00403 TaxID=2975990 RepID=UPI002E2241AB